MKITNAEFTISAVSSKQYPNDLLPEIALAGRSNVGKSSFINKLIQRKSLARTSSKPGKTQTLNYYKINNQFYFVDVPGYGYAQVSKKEREKWGQMMEEYFQTRDTLRAVILITDIRHEPTRDDVQMYDYLKYFSLDVIVIATKADKIPKGKKEQYVKRTRKILQMEQTDTIIAFSAQTGEGKDAAWGAIRHYLS
ncbi:ribosome biogenesis GTP-binding protein YihA/YsxC [Virgibacillus sp. 179-BFC.A HS]|uniref:Probable GTP-binding protein EngB n=1 Tax=Tigheibacillus jepli TaxID=3035914 RepID=A0ABU5CHJ5_9BACI|nr:ribosome biogenesis GTP-binding protein YihA/YsxC [Virgibacillus sp. 179-BFC.A HS]MDY0405431.1 ribosome biogenesis GTP-binding protein YihA/YsxC [Virgibacillus sp. 179-BFC.A HS]